jgi:hypothetical protein
MKTKTPLLLFVLALSAAAGTAPLGSLRSSSPVVTNETDAAFLGWYGGNHILLGAGAAAVDPEAPWPYHDIAIGAGSLTSDGGVAIGGSSTSSVSAVSVGASSAANPDGAAVGNGAKALGVRSTAVGSHAEASAPDCVQIGRGANDAPGTVRIRDWLLLDARGVIPPARLGSMPMRAALYSGSSVVAAPEVFLYWCTNTLGAASFPVSAVLPADSDAMQWDLWISAGEYGLDPARIQGVNWIGPSGPPEASRVAPGETLMLHCTAVRAPSGDTLVLAEHRATVAVTPAGCAPQTPRTAGRLRVAACDSTAFHPDGGADVYLADMPGNGAFGVAPSIPYAADGIAYEIWLRNASSTNVTPVAEDAGGRLSVLGTLPSVPSGGRCVLRCRSVRDGAFHPATVATVEGSTQSAALLMMSQPLALPQGDGVEEEEEEETR